MTRRRWLVLLGTAFAVRVVIDLGLLGGLPLFSDGLAYANQAKDLLADYGGSPAHYWPPGTSWVLMPIFAVTGESAEAARFMMILLSTGSVAATTLLAQRVLADARAAWLAGWLMAVTPVLVFMPSEPFSFDVTMLGLLLAVLAAVEAWQRRQLRWSLPGGLALGLAGAARPGSLSLLLALAVAGIVVLRRHRGAARVVLVGAVLFVAGTVLPLIPAVLHNHAKGQGYTISTNNDGNVLYGNNPFTSDYKTWNQGQHPFDSFPPAEAAYLNRNLATYTLQSRRRMRRLAKEYILDHPATFVWRTSNRVRAFWGFDYTFTDTLRGWDAVPLPLVGLAGALEVSSWFVLALLALVGLIVARPRIRPGYLALLTGVVLAYALPYFIAFSAGRWHAPLLGFIAIVAAAGLARATESRDAWRTVLLRRGVIIAVVVFGLLQAEYAYWVVRG